MHPFDRPRLKLERAKEHLDALNTELTVFYQRNPYTLVKKVNPKNGRQVFGAELSEEPPVRLGILAGDAVHNMRSALDWLVCELSLLNKAKTLKGIEFPIYKVKPSTKWGIERFERKIRFLPDEVKQAIKIIQPYHTGDHAEFQRLWKLQQLDITDKHRGLIIKGMVMEVPLPNVPGTVKRRLDDGTIEIIFPIKDYDFNPEPVAGVAFRAEELSQPVTPDMLRDIYHLIVGGIFPMFATYFPK